MSSLTASHCWHSGSPHPHSNNSVLWLVHVLSPVAILGPLGGDFARTDPFRAVYWSFQTCTAAQTHPTRLPVNLIACRRTVFTYISCYSQGAVRFLHIIRLISRKTSYSRSQVKILSYQFLKSIFHI